VLLIHKSNGGDKSCCIINDTKRYEMRTFCFRHVFIQVLVQEIKTIIKMMSAWKYYVSVSPFVTCETSVIMESLI